MFLDTINIGLCSVVPTEFFKVLSAVIGIPVLDGIKESIAFAKMMIENNY